MGRSEVHPAVRRGPGRPAGPRGAEGRASLLQAARELMNERGLPRVTAREVAERAGVQPALVNYYFGGKQGLLQAVTAEVAGEMRDRIQQTMELRGSFEERLRALVHGWTAAMAEDPYAPRLVVEQVLFADDEVIDAFVERFGRANAEAVTTLLEQAEAAGEIRPLEPAYLVPALLGMCIFYFLGAPIHERIFGRRRDAAGFAEAATELVMRGVVPADEGDEGAE